MISKNDIILLLTELQDNGLEVNDKIIEVFRSPNIPINVLQFINDNRQLDLTSFYEKLRKNYNNKKSKLYISIVKEITDPDEILTTLSAYNLQVILYSKKCTDAQMFLRHARVKEINMALAKYFTDYDLSICIELLKLIKADLLACETITMRHAI